MRSPVFLSALILAATLPLAASAQDAPRILSVAGHGEAAAAPDQVRVTAGVTASAATAAAALSANNARMKDVFAALAKLGVPEADIQTAHFSVSPQYAGGANNEPPRLSGYQVTNQVSVRLDAVAKLGPALDALVRAGANQMNGVDFSIRDTRQLLARARADAFADARTRAETYARAAGVTLGPILSISEGGTEVRPLRAAAPMMMAAKAVPVAAGEENVSADISVVWEIH
ncbi:MAG TPA: SIMPL domain-containing protein [Rhizomicrobium sp.]|nr:SIMPL domain-containing protein [Rhizomicrobium sp.]